MPLTPDQERLLHLERIFMPYAMGQREEARKQQEIVDIDTDRMRFVHYTSADAALNILQTKRIWMRNVTCMSDYHEVQHGFDILQRYFTPEKTKEFIGTLDLCMPGAAVQAMEHFNGWWNANIRLNTYVTSLSLHDRDEDQLGRLSMWRAFGAAPTRVAIVIKIPFYSGAVQELGLMFSPVAYLAEHEVHQTLTQVLKNVIEEVEFLRSQDKQTVVTYVFMMLFAAVACLKHRGFREEKEWRAVYCPQIIKSPLMEHSLESVSGVPQHVYKIPLDQTVSDKLAGLHLPDILDHLIIGPSPYPWVLYRAFVEILEVAGVPDARDKVLVSDIPIRV
jgi:hypothetical protein